jgi:molybdopterin/thiamine biosynthesis adenylyltransferase
MSVKPGRTACYRCVFPAPPADAPRCADAGVLGPAAGVVGGLQAVEVVKELVGFGRSLSGTLLLYDAAEPSLERLALRRNPACAEGCVRLGQGCRSRPPGRSLGCVLWRSGRRLVIAATKSLL